MKKILFILTIIIPLALRGQENRVDEDSMFSNPESVVFTDDIKPDEDKTKKHLGISGELNTVNRYSMTRDFINDGDSGGNQLYPYTIGTLTLDARLPDDVKGIANVEALYDARNSKSQFSMKEMFVQFHIDLNSERKLYITSGKQVLTWGRCYLWNPADLVNVEKKSFIKKIGSLEGTYGVKAHIPFGARYNMYAFASTVNASDIDEIAGAYKFEFVSGKTESAFSLWGKKNYSPVFAFDISTRILHLDILGEATVSKGDNNYKVRETGGFPNTLYKYRDDEKIISKASIDIGRSIDWGDQLDKISIHAEFFYNKAGYSKNIFSDTGIYTYDAPLTIADSDGNKAILPGGDKKTYMYGNKMYEPNYYSRYYAALFTSLNKFIVSELTLNMNLIGNIQQRSFILSTGIDYLNINNFKASLYVYSYIGPAKTEYTVMNNAADILVMAGMIF